MGAYKLIKMEYCTKKESINRLLTVFSRASCERYEKKFRGRISQDKGIFIYHMEYGMQRFDKSRIQI